VVLDTGAKTIHLVPGLENRGLHPDVMRGEETQIVGVLALQPHLGDRSLLVLPGTHCKWVTVEQERVTRFTTYLTGELFAMLRDHSILGRPAKESGQPAGPDALDQDAFVRGVHAVRDGGAAGVAPRLFSTRSLFLAGVLTAPQTIDYLSGMLIGEEIRSVLADLAGESCPPLVLLGAPSLCERYRLALAESGIDTVNVMNETGPSGLWRIATAAGLVT
jgi:2-dehydro-3-deoxygalactonokinase